MSGDDEDERRSRRRPRIDRTDREDNPSERRGRGGSSFDEDGYEEIGEDEFDSITAQTDESELEVGEGSVELVRPLEQDSISKKIDFLFVIDASSENQKYIELSNVENKLGSFLHQLDRINIDWRIYVINADSGKNKKRNAHRNGLLSNFENAGTEILTQYLDKNILDPYGSSINLTDVFLHTISHGSKRDCKLPPYCHKAKDHKPLKAISQFLSRSSNVLKEREGADLISIIISSQDETPKSRKKYPYDASDLVNLFKSLFSGEDKNFYAISIVLPTDESRCPARKRSRSEKPASYIPRLSVITKGMIIPICSSQQEAYSTNIIEFIQENS